ncbi:MAG: Gfo/Idh/MocA family oxidoreductase [Clostridiales bacterium]|nr:Gfo/Idh/MocA family oxidoreductase [Clostridiales bacterium]
MKKVRVGIIGAGGIANTHLAAYSNCENAEVAAICDINEERLNKTADKFGIKNRYTSVEEMLAKETLDAADVCVWNNNHAKCTIAALNAGLHVLCEKPMACSAKEGELMKKAAEENGKLLMIGFVLRFDNMSEITKDFIDKGYFGNIYHSKATYLRRHGAPGGWFCNKEISGGGPVIDIGVHVIDLTRYLMGNPKPVSVYAVTADKLGKRSNLKTGVGWTPEDAKDEDVFNVEDFATEIIRYDNGSTTLLETSYSLNGEPCTKKELFGDKGGIKIDENGFKIYTEMNDYMVDVTPNLDNYKQESNLFTNEMEHFIDCILNNTPCRAPAEDGIEVMRILDAIYESARTGHEVLL